VHSYKTYGIISGISFILWWGLSPLLLPLESLRMDYSLLILDPAWLPLNLLQVLAILALTMFFLEFSRRHYRESAPAGLFKCLEVVGLFCFSGVAFYEAFLWPIVAANAPGLLNVVSGPVYTSGIYLIATSVGIFAFMFGNIYLGIQIFRQNRVVAVFYIAGVVFLCFSYVSGDIRYVLQTAGIMLMGLGLIAIGLLKRKEA
jgi:hypothetical protein